MTTQAADLLRIACLSDNFVWLIHDPLTGRTGCVDVPEAAPVMAALQDRGWKLSEILLTHHHPDHIQGANALHHATGARIMGAKADQHRLPPLYRALSPGETVDLGALSFAVLDVPGHTRGHIAYYSAGAGMAFTGDSLMGLGCGRLFEGSAQEMWASLSQLAALPPDTLIGSGHDYGAGNARFALSVDPENAALQTRAARIKAGEICVPATLAEELATNPFLRADQPALRRAADLPGSATPLEVFTALRRMKDNA